MPHNSNAPSRTSPCLVFVIWMAVAVAGCLVPVSAAHAGNDRTFSIDLDRLTQIYDDLYPERTATAAWDTTRAFDFGRIQIGSANYKIPHFLKSSWQRTRKQVEYEYVPGYRVTFDIPRTYSFAFRDSTAGDYVVQVPRDLNIPGLGIELERIDDIVTDVYENSLRDAWKESVLLALASLQRGTGGGGGGVTINIPLPMPKQLEGIFGPADKTHINISGREEITFAGETRIVDPFVGVEGRQSQSLFPSLQMEQQLDVKLAGTIGDKVNIQVDHSSQDIADDANRIRLNYTGYEDDVIQLIELGNTSLSLPGSQLVSISSQSRGLFGVKVLAQLGATDITAIASKQEGEVSSSSFSPTAGTIGQSEEKLIRDIDYVRNKYFFFHNPEAFIGPTDTSLIDVYRTVRPEDLIGDPTILRKPGRAFVDRLGDGSDINTQMDLIRSGQPLTADVYDAEFQLLERGVDYDFLVDAASDAFVGIELNQPISDQAQKAIAVRYRNTFGSPIGGSYASYGVIDSTRVPPVPTVPGSENDRLVLKLIKAPDPRPTGQFSETWNYMIRRIYNLGLSNIDGNSFTLEIEDVLTPRLDQTAPEGSDVSYLQIFGLDNFDQSGLPGHDGRVDLNSGLIDLNNGLLTFLDLRPFAPAEANVATWTEGRYTFRDTTVTDSVAYIPQYNKSRSVYDKFLTQNQLIDAHQYNIRVRAVSTTKTFRIDALNVIENSERITLDGRTLARGTDYDIDYTTGEVELKGTVLNDLQPDSRINIDFEYKPFGGGASSSLVGFSTISRIGENARLGTTALYESKSVSSEKPRLGDEPTRAIVAGVNGSVSHTSEVLTSLANMLPLVDTDAASALTINGELAMSIPNPNTRGEAYIDDFEGVEDSDRLPLSRRSWYRASLPIEDDGMTAKEDTTRLGFQWYNIEPELGVHRRDLNPELDERENSLVTSLDIELDASLPAATDTTRYAGIMTGFGGGGLDLTQGQFIEIWINDFKPDPATRGGVLHIDMGTIDENFFQMNLGVFDDEDRDRDGFAAAFDDTGLDGLFNPEEPGYVESSNPDPNRDDIDLSRINGRFTKVNGTEANRVYDTEDLDRNGVLNRTNAYFSFVVDLADTAAVDIRAEYPTYDGFEKTAHTRDSWRLYRVKLSDSKIVSPRGDEPRLDQIRQLRVWFDDVNSVVQTAEEPGVRRLQIAEFKIQGNRWELDGIRDLANDPIEGTPTDFTIGVIGTKTDPGVYIPPVRPNEQNGVFEKESSLALDYTDIEEGSQVRIVKRFPSNGIDLTLYRDLNFWVHTDSLRAGAEYYFRLATTENNYYEVSVPFTSIFYNSTGWSRVIFKIEDLTNLKFAPADTVVRGTAQDLVEENREYPISLVGLPSMLNIRFLYAGVRNTGNPVPISGQIWMNDIFTGDVMRDFDHAERLGVSLNVAGGAISLGGTWSRTGADFRGLRQRRGSGDDATAYAMNAKTNLQYFVPLAGFSVPVSGGYGQSKSLPKFPPNSDTQINDPAVRDSLSTERMSRQFSTSLSKRGSKNVLLKYTFDKMTTNFSYSNSRFRSPSSMDTTTTLSGSFGYRINWPGQKTIKFLGANAIRWWPNAIEYSASASRRTQTRSRFLNGSFRPDPFLYSAQLNQTGSINYQPFRSLGGNIRGGLNRDLALPHEWMGIDIGIETSRNHDARLKFTPPPTWPLIRLFEPNVDVTTGYDENSSPNVRRPGDPKGTRNVSAQRQLTGRARLDIGKHFESLFGALGWKPTKARPVSQPRPTGQQSGAVGADSTAAPADTTARQRPGAKTLFRQVGFVLTEIRRVNVSASHRTNNSYTRIPGRPSLSYQFGLDPSTGIATDDGPIDTPDRLSSSVALSADSGVKLSENMDVQGRYSRSISDTDFRASKTRGVSTTFPDFQFNWKGLQNFSLFKSLFTAVTASLNWKGFTQESGLRDRPPDNATETLTLAPALLFAWKNEVNTNLSVAYNKRTNTQRGSVSETSGISVTLDFKKTIHGGSGFKIPLPFLSKEVKWSSTLDTNMQITYSRNAGKRFTEGSDVFQPIPKSTSLRVSPNMSYRFSNSLSGRAFVDYTRSFTEATDQTVTTVRIGVSAIFTF